MSLIKGDFSRSYFCYGNLMCHENDNVITKSDCRFLSRVEGRGSRVEGRGSRVEGRGSRVEGRGSRVQGPGSRVQVMFKKVNILSYIILIHNANSAVRFFQNFLALRLLCKRLRSFLFFFFVSNPMEKSVER